MFSDTKNLFKFYLLTISHVSGMVWNVWSTCPFPCTYRTYIYTNRLMLLVYRVGLHTRQYNVQAPYGCAVSDAGASVNGAAPGPGYRKFRGLFQFDARNSDELSFTTGDIVWVGCTAATDLTVDVNFTDVRIT